MRPGLIRVLPAVVWTVFIVYALASEPSALPKYRWLGFPYVDKLIHGVLFFIEAGALAGAMRFRPDVAAAILISAGCLILGGSLEVVQHYWVEGRSGQPLDLLADMLGALLSIALIKAFFR